MPVFRFESGHRYWLEIIHTCRAGEHRASPRAWSGQGHTLFAGWSGPPRLQRREIRNKGMMLWKARSDRPEPDDTSASENHTRGESKPTLFTLWPIFTYTALHFPFGLSSNFASPGFIFLHVSRFSKFILFFSFPPIFSASPSQKCFLYRSGPFP